jgi:LmbE family N-acetylglucosaminyl deacetylase
MSRAGRLIRRLNFFSGAMRERWSAFTLLPQPPGSRVLVIAPHPDDETFGCGGSIVLHRQLGHGVDIVYLSNGEAGITGSNQTETSRLRKEECIRAMQILNVVEGALHFLQLPDGNLANHSGKHVVFSEIMNAVKPDIIYLPSFMERHPDHVSANVFLRSNLERSVTIAAYEIWTPLIANRLIDISAVMEIKQAAMQQYTSQLQALDYADAMTGINRYRGAMYGKEVRFAEAFILLSSKEYFDLNT